MRGGQDVGVDPARFPGGTAISAESAEELGKRWGFPVPSETGKWTGDADFSYQLGGAVVAPVAPLRVHQLAHLDPSAVTGDGMILLLPSLSRYEQKGGGVLTSADRTIYYSPELTSTSPPPEARSGWAIAGWVAGAARPERGRAVTWANSWDIRREMEENSQMFEGLASLRSSGDRRQPGGPALCAGGTFVGLPEGRAQFLADSLESG